MQRRRRQLAAQILRWPHNDQRLPWARHGGGVGRIAHEVAAVVPAPAPDDRGAIGEEGLAIVGAALCRRALDIGRVRLAPPLGGQGSIVNHRPLPW